MAHIVILGARTGGMPPPTSCATRSATITTSKVAFEKRFMYKIKSGSSEAVYERRVMKLLGVERLDP